MGQLLHAAGVDMGTPDTFFPADRWNPDGYYEQRDIIRVNKALVHGPFWKFAYFRLPSTETILKRAQRQAASIQEAARKYKGKAVKDPRFCLTLPAWLRYGAGIDRILICLRDPIQVAQSIWKRNHVATWYGLQLWYIHNKTLLDHIAGIPVWYADYGSIMDPETSVGELRRALRFLGYEFPEAELAAFVVQCVKPALHRNTGTAQAYPDPVQRLWDDLRARHAAQS
ncbi:MAG: hypothetical protein Kow00120_18860 [Anaerolineae bacterium]